MMVERTVEMTDAKKASSKAVWKANESVVDWVASKAFATAA